MKRLRTYTKFTQADNRVPPDGLRMSALGNARDN